MNSLNHIAIIMDGNGRWASQKNKPRSYGHNMGVANIRNIIKVCMTENIKYLTLFVFSIDNWKRDKSEILFLFNLISKYLKKNFFFIKKNKIKIKIIGEKKNIKKNLLKSFKKIELETCKNRNLILNLAFNYSSKYEILNAIKKISKNKKKELTTDLISNNLYTSNAPDPDLLIRTGGRNRLSDFMLWQISYAEIFFIKKLWPDFSKNDLTRIITKFKNIKRNFGAINV